LTITLPSYLSARRPNSKDETFSVLTDVLYDAAVLGLTVDEQLKKQASYYL